MENSSNHTKYTWGELYETLKELEEKGDCHEDKELQKTCTLISSLEKTKTMRAAKKLIKSAIISDYELQRINSPCLEGLLLTGTDKDPIIMLMKLCPHYMDTFRFYMDRITTYSNFSEACVYGTKEMIELLTNKNISHYRLTRAIFVAKYKERHDIVQFLKEKYPDITVRIETDIAPEYYYYIVTNL